MARLGMANFTHGNFGLLTKYGDAYITDGINGKCMYVGDYEGGIFYTSKSEIYVAFLFKPNTISDMKIVEFKSGSDILACLCRNGVTGVLQAYRGSWSSLLGSSANSLTLNQVGLIEVRYKPHDVSGVFQVKFNGLLEIDYSGDTTQYGAAIDHIMFGHTGGTTAVDGYYDNIVIDDANWPGDSLQAYLTPSVAGNTTQWDVSSGANYDAVDETPANDLDGVRTNVADEIDSYAAADLPADASGVVCVIPEFRAWRHGVSTPTKVAPGLRTGGVNYFGSGVTLAAFGATHGGTVYESNPNTSSPWVVSEVNGAEVAIKAVS